MIIEVFRTNVQTYDQAMWLTERIQKLCISYRVNFDLDDCDRILRIKNLDGHVSVHDIIRTMNNAGFYAEVLEDDVPANEWYPLKSSLLNLFELN